jgi:hypothetical protein
MSDSLEEQRLWAASLAKVEAQDAARGDWADPRRAQMPDPPWPSRDDPTLRALLDQARRQLATEGVEAALIHLATHCWFEGGIEAYDRGQQDARRGQGH